VNVIIHKEYLVAIEANYLCFISYKIKDAEMVEAKDIK
jgi:hypothetical protein